jgi:hypothetical protein
MQYPLELKKEDVLVSQSIRPPDLNALSLALATSLSFHSSAMAKQSCSKVSTSLGEGHARGDTDGEVGFLFEGDLDGGWRRLHLL